MNIRPSRYLVAIHRPPTSRFPAQARIFRRKGAFVAAAGGLVLFTSATYSPGEVAVQAEPATEVAPVGGEQVAPAPAETHSMRQIAPEQSPALGSESQSGFPSPLPIPPSPAELPPPPPPPPPPPVNNLDGWIRQAQGVLARNGIPVPSYHGIHRNIIRESSGNPNAVNNWDINAINGTPSKGLLQTIDPTFFAYHVPGTALNPFDPIANIAAACNYAWHRYGGMDFVNGAY